MQCCITLYWRSSWIFLLKMQSAMRKRVLRVLFWSLCVELHSLFFDADSWLWRLQSIRLPGISSEVCTIPYCKYLVFFIFSSRESYFCCFVWHFSCMTPNCVCRTGFRINACWRRPLRKWQFSISHSGEHVSIHWFLSGLGSRNQ